jgi:glutamine amidotransferase
MIAIIDYGAGNLRSIRTALERVGATVAMAVEPGIVAAASAVVLPGVGAAGPTMRRLQETGLDDALRQVFHSGKPFLGICLGLQLLFQQHEEGDVPGLGLLAGSARRLPAGLKIPHMGWNQIEPWYSSWNEAGAAQSMFADIPPGSYVYFVHSFYVDPVDPTVIAARTTYGIPFCSAIASGQVWGTQFHPEKSGEVGLRLLRNFVRFCKS